MEKLIKRMMVVVFMAAFASYVQAQPTLQLTVTSDAGYAFGSQARIVPVGTIVNVSWKAEGVSSCRIGEWSGVTGSRQLVMTESVNLAATCEVAGKVVAEQPFNIVVNKAGTYGLCEGDTSVGIDEEAKLYMVATGDYKVTWTAIGGEGGGNADMSQIFRTRFSRPGTYTVTGITESGIVGKCQVQVYDSKQKAGTAVRVSATRGADGISIESLDGDLPAGRIEWISGNRNPFTRSNIAVLPDGISHAEPYLLPAFGSGPVDLVYTSKDGALAFRLRVQ